MDDRELLELAAKAAGIKHPGGEHCINGPAVWDCEALRWWRPLTDDGDALRLAVKLCMNCDFLGAMTGVIFINPSDEDKDGHLQEGPHKGVSDLQSARRAIVRAAAEIGRAM